MKKQHERETGAQKNENGISRLPKLEMYAVLGLELGQKILEDVQKLEKSVEVLAMQKARELEAEKAAAKPAS